MKTIELKGYTLDVYVDGKIYIHPRVITTSDGRKIRMKGYFPKQHDNNNGYIYVGFWYQGRNKSEGVHRVVAKVFIPNPCNLKEVNHIDGNKKNNHVSNLEWCDRTYNVNDYVKKGRGVYGWRRIAQYSLNGELIKEWSDITSAAKSVNCTHENISSALRGKTNTAKGYKWKYSEAPKRKGHYAKNFIQHGIF